ncbi:MAG TPA: RNA polymerase sigma-70 factor [Bacteroidales bacterium]
MENITTAELLLLIKTGNKAAFDLLFSMFYIRLRNYSLRITNDLKASEDIVQDIFFNLWTKPELVDKINSLEAYLRVSVYNRSIGLVKEKSKRNIAQLNSRFIELEEIHLEILEYHRDFLIEKELTLEISKAVESLPEQCRLVFKLSRNFGFKNVEIAEYLGISIKGVEKHITKALLHLRKELKEFLTIFIALFFLS